MPGQLADLERCRPVYETLPGWPDDLTKARRWADLPAAARDYVEFLAEQIGVPVSIVSVGPERTQTITERRRWYRERGHRARWHRRVSRSSPIGETERDERS